MKSLAMYHWWLVQWLILPFCPNFWEGGGDLETSLTNLRECRWRGDDAKGGGDTLTRHRRIEVVSVFCTQRWWGALKHCLC